MRSFVAQGPMLIPSGGGGYQGPGDLFNFNVFYGLRAFKASSIGTQNVIRIHDNSNSAEQDFGTVAGGGLDTAGISTFLGGHNGSVQTLYDLTGGGQNISFTGGIRMPYRPTAGVGSGLAYSVGGTGGGANGPSGTMTDIAQTFSIVSVVNFDNTSGQDIVRCASGTVEQGAFRIAANGKVFMEAATIADSTAATLTSGVGYCLVSRFSGATSQVQINGTTSSLSANPGTNNTGTSINFFEGFIGTQIFTGRWVESGIINSDITGNTTYWTNAQSFWGL